MQTQIQRVILYSKQVFKNPFQTTQIINCFHQNKSESLIVWIKTNHRG